MDRQDTERVAERAAEALGPEAGLVASLDPVSLARAMAEVGAGLARHPFGGALAGLRYAAGLAATGAVGAARFLGAQTSPPIPPPAGDRRFADTAVYSRRVNQPPEASLSRVKGLTVRGGPP